jgi:hypothetical protein
MEVRKEAPYEEQQNSTEQKARNWMRPAGGGKDCVRKEHKKANLPKKGGNKKKKTRWNEVNLLIYSNKNQSTFTVPPAATAVRVFVVAS